MWLCEFLSINAERLRHFDQIRERPRPHLPHHMAAMNLDRDLAEAHLGRNLLVRQAGGDEGHHLPLSRAIAAATASSISWSRNGFVRKSIAPAFMARTDIGISPWAVTKMIGIWIPALINSA